MGFSKETSFQEIVPKFKIFFNFSDVEGIKGSHTRPSIAQICKEIFIIVLTLSDFSVLISFHGSSSAKYLFPVLARSITVFTASVFGFYLVFYFYQQV